MQTITILFATLIVAGVILIWREVDHGLERRRLHRTIADLQNRLMAKNLPEYASVTQALEPERQRAEAEADEAEREEIERAMDRIPIN